MGIWDRATELYSRGAQIYAGVRSALTLSGPYGPAPADAIGRRIGGGRTIIPNISGKPNTEEFTDLIVGSSTSWSLDRVKGALAQHELGQFGSSAQLIDFMLRDDRISGCMDTRSLGINGLPRECRPPKDCENIELAKQAAKALEQDWQWIFPERVLSDTIQWGAMAGFCLHEIVWDTHGTRWVPQLKFWHPQYVYYRADIRRYVAIAAEGSIIVEPGDGRWFLYSPHTHYRAWMHGAVRSLVLPWMLRQYAYRDWGRNNEVLGIPTRVARVPAFASDYDKRTFWGQIAALGSAGVLMLPEGSDGQKFGYELVEAANHQSWEAFERAMIRGDTNINMRLLGQNMSGGEIRSGSHAAAKVADGVRDDIKAAEAGTIWNDLRSQVIRPYTIYNFGDEDVTPDGGWDASPQEDKEKSAETFKTVAEGAQIFWKMGVEVEFDKLSDRYSLPLKPGTKPTVAPAPDATPPTTGAPAAAGASTDGSNGTDVTDPPAAQSQTHSRRGGRAIDAVIDGQVFVDAVGDKAARVGAAMLRRVVLAKVFELLEQSTSYDQLRVKLIASFPEIDPSELMGLIEGATRVGAYAGAFSVRREADAK